MVRGLLNLKKAFTVEFEAISSYNFELNLRKPAGWYWSTPEETCEKDTSRERRVLTVNC